MQPEVQSKTVSEPAVLAELRALVQRAKGGDVSVLPREGTGRPE